VRYPIVARQIAAVNPEFLGKTGRNPRIPGTLCVFRYGRDQGSRLHNAKFFS
jgi:hypothetical protein